MSRTIDLNADLGEGGAFDAEIILLVSSINLACGGHAGDACTMARAEALARSHGVAIGAHPSFVDRAHFGRQPLAVHPSVLRRQLREQLEALRALTRFTHVKPHGALYNLAARDATMARLVVDVVREFDARLSLVALAGSLLVTRARSAGLNAVEEIFADRGYAPDGSLLPRGVPGGLIDDPAVAASQVVSAVVDGRLRDCDGAWINVRADTVCIHGDGREAIALLRAIRQALHEAGVTVQAFSTQGSGRGER